MLVDLHVHYPMHVMSELKTRTTVRRMKAMRKRPWSDKLRALILKIASLLFNSRDGHWRVTTALLRKGGVGIAMSALYCPFEEMDLDNRFNADPESGYFARLLKALKEVEDDVRADDPAVIRIVHDRRELDESLRDGATAVVHCVEGGFHLGDSDDEIRRNVATLADHGVAYLTPAHLFFRQVATNAPALPFLRTDGVYHKLFPQPASAALTHRGRTALEAMVKSGVLIDISHMSAVAVKETFELLDDLDRERTIPVIASHGGYRFGRQEYMLDDWTVRQIKRRDGVIGLIMAQYQLNDGLRRRRTRSLEESLHVIFEHIDKIESITGGYETVALGSDFDGFIKPTMRGLEDSGELDELERALRDRYGADAELICCGNAQRVLQKLWPT